MHGWRALVLGVDTPPQQIAALARDLPVGAIALSVVRRRGAGAAASDLGRLRRALRRAVPVLVGGAGAGGARAGVTAGRRAAVEVFDDLVALDRWVRGRHAA